MRTLFYAAVPALAALASCSSSPSAVVAPVAPIAPTTPPASASAASGAAPVAEAQSPARAVREATLASSKALDTVRSLVVEVGPRLSGSVGTNASIEWALRTLTAAGLANVHAEKVHIPHWERGEERGEILTPLRRSLALAALGGSVGTTGDGVEAEVVEVASREAMEKLDPAKAKGKIVFCDGKMERTHDGAGYGAAIWMRMRCPSQAAKLGALGLVIRSVGTGDQRAPHTGALHYEKDIAKIPAAALAIPDAEVLHGLLASGKTVRLAMKLGAKQLPEVDGANVIGEVPGRELPGEIVLLGAHLDSWDLGHGAEDDGAGCGIVIEAARQIALAKLKPRRTVRVVLFANEENGGAGSKGYAAAHAGETAKHVLALEADLGSGAAYEARFLGPEGARAQFLSVAAIAAPLGVAVSKEYAHGGADIEPLKALGVPVMDLEQDASRYFDVHHTANDVIEHIRKEEIDQVAAAFAGVAYAAADATSDFGRTPEDVLEAAEKRH